MVRRMVAAGLVAMIALTGVSPLVACAGWQASAAARHACCVTMGCSHSGSTSDTDACCAQKESTSHQSQAERAHVDGTVALVPTSVPGSLNVWLRPAANHLTYQVGTHSPHTESSLYLRYSLLRI